MMAAGDDLARALGDLEIIDQLPEFIDERTAKWRQKCSELTKLILDFKRGEINRNLLKYSDRSPRCFSISREVMEGVFNATVEQIEGVSNLMTCPRHQYATCLRLLLGAEEIYQAVEMRKHKLDSQQLEIVTDAAENVTRFGFRMANLANKSPSINPTDYVILQDRDGLQFAVQILNAVNDYIYLPKEAAIRYSYSWTKPVKVSFVSAGTPFRMCQRAIEELQASTTMRELVFEDVGSPENEVKIQATGVGDLEELDKRLDKLNECQRAAVVGILEAKCRPKAYILFGPPGTGKTHTLVEAVVQVYNRSRCERARPSRREFSGNDYDSDLEDPFSQSDDNSFGSDYAPDSRIGGTSILVCINSNNCTDELYEKIKKELPDVDVTRLSAGSFPDRGDDPEIVVTTNIKSGAYKDIEWKFDYVFVDEAGHANMAESLVPASVLKRDGCLVLAGDPHQLGPVVTCDGAAKMGLEESLLERLFRFNLYQKDPVTREYDGRYITMLQDCYRCDPRILTTCNRLFYDNRLRCVNSTPRGLLKILQLTGPLQMRHVIGTETQMAGSDSWYNQAEIDVCVDLVKRLYLMGFEPHQIGVTSPYKLQANKIRYAMRGAIELNRVTSSTIKERFSRIEFVPIARWATFEDGITPEAIRGLNLPASATLCKKITNGSFVGCSIYALPTNLEDLFVRRVLRETNWVCKVDSIDAFQGGEKEVMIISTVRTSGNTRFISDKRRFNVAISRAKWLVIVVGDLQTLRGARYWDELLMETESEVDSWPRSVYCSQPFSQQQPLFRSR